MFERTYRYLYGSLKATRMSGAPLPGSWMMSFTTPLINPCLSAKSIARYLAGPLRVRVRALKIPPAPLRQVRMIRPISNYLKYKYLFMPLGSVCQQIYSNPPDWAAIILAFLSFFWETFFGPDSAARATATSCSLNMISTWHGEAMYGLIRPWAL